MQIARSGILDQLLSDHFRISCGVRQNLKTHTHIYILIKLIDCGACISLFINIYFFKIYLYLYVWLVSKNCISCLDIYIKNSENLSTRAAGHTQDTNRYH